MKSSRAYTPLILAGGLGTRLAGALPGLPKVLAPVLDRPFITFILDVLIEGGFSEAVICTGFRADLVESQLGARYGMLQLRYSRETHSLGTGGALRLAATTASTPWLLVMNGDSYCGVNIRHFIDWHGQRSEPVGLVLTEVADARRYGGVELDRTDRILAFREKSPEATGGPINAGIYSLPRALLEGFAPEQPFSLEKDAFPGWIVAGMAGFRAAGPFIDIGVPESYRLADAFFATRRLTQPT